MAQLHTCHPTYLVADSALYSAENLQKLAETSLKWITRVPATLHEAQAVLAQTNPQTMAPLRRAIAITWCHRAMGVSRNAGCSSTPSRASRTPSAPWTSSGSSRVPTKSKPSRRWAARPLPVKRMPTGPDAFAHDVQTTFLSDSTVYPTPQYGKQGRPGPGAQPDQLVYHITGALASRLTDRQARVDQQSCFILATNELDEGQLSAQAVLDGYKGKPKRNAGCASSKTRNFWPPRSISKNPNASWPC